MANWRLSDAKRELDKVAEDAYSKGPQTITLSRGRRVVVTKAPPRRSMKGKAKTLRGVFGDVPLADIIPARSKEPIRNDSIFE